ncbi:ABC transporter ATP-binding protein [Streptomyces noursei]|uniref:ABC transporter permease n=1 Tax=Streptomyces noursei TaxID=1971 RepID=A0A401RDL9_STRNR|nr:ABC transporter ATP-binding protein [Streptomyces noursei]AKA07735.1 ABC transporter [Streptomyces noursei ZPM]UWS76322.1 ABC transporter ATP-binding protein/permease [Streptomyces noursei]GCB95726.1 ABC transporter permease [Streptomyces noursei]
MSRAGPRCCTRGDARGADAAGAATPSAGARERTCERWWRTTKSPPAAPASGGADAVVEAAPPVALREVFRRFWPYTRGGRPWFVVILGLVVLGPVVDAAEVWLFKILIDDVLIPRDPHLLVPVALAFLGLTLLAGALDFADDVTSTWVSERFLLALRSALFRHVEGLSLGFFERRRLGDVLSRMTGDVDAVETFLLSGIVNALAQVVRLGVFLGVLSYLSWHLTLLAVVIVPMFWCTARWFSRRVKTVARERRRRSGSISAIAEETLGNIALVQAYNRQRWEHGRFERENLGRFRAVMASARIGAVYATVVELIELVGALLVLGLGTWELIRGQLTLGGLMVFLTLLSRLYSPIRGLSGLSNTFSSASASAERIIELLDQRPQVRQRATPRTPGRCRGEIAFDDVSFRYPGATAPALVGVSFRVAPGETLALVGASGAGKTTVAKLLLRFYDPDRGTVRLDGHDLRDLSLDALRDNVAVLLQETLVLHGTVRDNIVYGRPGVGDAEIVAAARAADAHGFISQLPDGYDTVVGQRGRLLSGGQRQRLAIARAMVRDAPLLVLDEPTTGLDAESGRRILHPLRRLMRGRTTILISHDLLTVRDATRILLLDHGRVTARGTHRELLARSAAYARLYRPYETTAGPQAGGPSRGP